MKDIVEVEAFYNEFSGQLLTDYLTGNDRLEAAISFVLENIPSDTGNILDIGCGLGWSSFEFAQHYPKATIQGVDLSENLLANAQKLFKAPNLTYKKVDVTSKKFMFNHTFDVLIMLDVYEHIPKEERNSFHKSLKEILSEKGRMMLTCPSHFHQDWLRQNAPGRLQPVDEDVTLEDMFQLAKDLGGHLSQFVYTSIWKTNDYFHVLIQKEISYQDKPKQANITTSNKLSRLFRVLTRVNFAQNPLRHWGTFKYFLKRFFRK